MINCTFEDGNQNSLRHVTVGCLVVKDGKILLAKRSPKLLEGGKWCLLGGYVERDETTAEAGIRETKEESGWEVKDLQLLRINDNPNRPHEDRQNVDILYIATAVQKTGESDWESQEVRWFPLEELPPPDEIAFDHLDSILLLKKHLESPLQLPVLGPVSHLLQ